MDTTIGEIQATIRPEAAEAYIWDCAILPPYRGRGLYTELLHHIVADLTRDRVQRIWIASLESNRPGWHAIARAGFLPILRIAYVRVPGRRWWRIRGASGARSEDVEAARRRLTVGPPARPTAPTATR